MRENRHIIGLDLLRFAAAVLVLLHHYAFWVYAGASQSHEIGTDVSYRYLAPYTWSGWVGVEIFFLLSGFVIAYSAQNVSAARFVRSRFLRLYPAAWICATTSLIALLFSGDSISRLLLQWLHSLLLLPGPDGFYIDPSYWTLPIELSFYLLILALLATHSFRRLPLVAAILAVYSAAFNLLEAPLHLPGAALTSLQMSLHHLPPAFTWIAPVLLLRHGVFFAMGATLWLSLLDRPTPFRTAILAVCLAGGVLEIRTHALSMLSVIRMSLTWTVALALWLLALCSLVLSVRYNKGIASRLSPAATRLFRNLGLVTYPLYLVHQRAGYLLIHLLHGRIPDLAAMSCTAAVSFAVAWFIALHAENALRKPLENLFPRQEHLRPTEKPAATLP